MTAAEEGTHPRPQLRRPDWQELSGSWRFGVDRDGVGIEAGWPTRPDLYPDTIVVPFPPGSASSGVDDVGQRDAVWYQRDFDAPHRRPDERVLLHFQAVDYRAQVWVNGHLLASHEGGHTPFSADITPYLRDDGQQLLAVRAEDRADDLEQPRGKQGWHPGPYRIWHDRTTGIWQRVWLELVPATRIDSVRWTPDVDSASLQLDARVRVATPGPLSLRVRLSIRDELLVDDTYEVVGERVRRTFTLAGRTTGLDRRAYVWAPEYPNLIQADLVLLGPEGPVDQVASYTALRSVGAARSRILLNGRPYFLRMVLDHGYWPESRLAAAHPGALRADVELIKQLGFNGVRMHQKVEDPEFLYWCDRLGLLVWAEMPATYEFSSLSVERLAAEWLEVLRRDYNHPCIVAWVPVNESWGVPALSGSSRQRSLVHALYHLAKASDGTRLVVGNDGWENLVSDLLTVHAYSDGRTLRARYGSAEALRDTLSSVQPHYRFLLLDEAQLPDRPVVVSECGGRALPEADDAWTGYGVARSSEDLLEHYSDVLDALLDSPVIAGFCYTQLTDTALEPNGLVTERRVPKLDPARIRGVTRRAAAGVPGDVSAAFEYGDYPGSRS